MKPPSARHSGILATGPERLEPSSLVSVLRHENQLLRARLEGRGRIEVDPELQDRLQAAAAENRRLARELERVRTVEADLRQRLHSRNEQGAHILNRLNALATQVKQQQDQLGRVVEGIDDGQGRAEVDQPAPALRRRLEASEVEADRLRGELTQSRADLERLLDRIASTPLAVVFRRWKGYRAIEDRWSTR